MGLQVFLGAVKRCALGVSISLSVVEDGCLLLSQVRLHLDFLIEFSDGNLCDAFRRDQLLHFVCDPCKKLHAGRWLNSSSHWRGRYTRPLISYLNALCVRGLLCVWVLEQLWQADR